MRFKIIVTSVWNMDDVMFYKEIIERYPFLKEFDFDRGYIVINSIQDLMRLRNFVYEVDDAYELIITGSMNKPAIEIYDDYRE